MLMRIHRRFCRRTGVGLAALMAASLLLANPAAAFRGKRIVVDRHGPGDPIGRRVARLPPGYSRVRVGAVPYYFSGGRYYRPARGGYVHVRPPMGAVLAALPLGFLTLAVGSLIYYYHSDVYYRRVPAGYMVVDAPRDVVVVHETPADAGTQAENGDRVTVTAPRLNVRSGPGSSFGVIAVVDQGAVLEVRGSAPDWLYTRLGDGQYGWVMEIYTTPTLPPSSG
jgi:anaerobic selenocysteine-containing dehydrogenase